MTWIEAGGCAREHYEKNLPSYVSRNTGLGRNRYVEITVTGAGCEETLFQTFLDYWISETARKIRQPADVFGAPLRLLFPIPKKLEKMV